MDKAKELSKNPFKYQNKYDKEMEVFNKIIAKNDKIIDSEKDEKLGKDFETVLLKTKDPIQAHIKALVLRDLGYTDYAQLFFSKAVELGYIIESVAIEEPDVDFDEIQKHIENKLKSHKIEIEYAGNNINTQDVVLVTFNSNNVTIKLVDESEFTIPNGSLTKLFSGDQLVQKDANGVFFGMTLIKKQNEAMGENNNKILTKKEEKFKNEYGTYLQNFVDKNKGVKISELAIKIKTISPQLKHYRVDVIEKYLKMFTNIKINEGRNDYYDNLDSLYHRFSGGYMPSQDPTLTDRIDDFIESLDIDFDKQEVRDYLNIFVQTEKADDATLQTMEAYTPGDKYSRDFDYNGMFDFALTIDENTPIETLKALYSSIVDTNYHDEAVELDMLIQNLEDGKGADFDAFKYMLSAYTEAIKSGTFNAPIVETIGSTNLEEDIAKNLFPKIQALQIENGVYTVKQLEEEIIGNGGTLEMTDNVMAFLVSMGINFDNEVDESIQNNYHDYFLSKLHDYQVHSPSDLTDEQWEEIDNGWVSEDESGYEQYFLNKLHDFQVHSPTELTDEQWEEIDNGWISEEEKIKEGINMLADEPECINDEEHNWVPTGDYEVKCTKCNLNKTVDEDSTNENNEETLTFAHLEKGDILYRKNSKDILNVQSITGDSAVLYNNITGERFTITSLDDYTTDKINDITETKITLATPIGNSHKQIMPNADAFKGHNIFKAEDKPERPAYNIDAVKRMIENDSFLMFSYNNLLSGVFEKDMDLIYDTYIKNDSDYLDKLKTFEAYTKMLKENVIVQSMYGSMIEDAIKHFNLNLEEDETEISYAMAEFVSENKAKFKSYFALFTPDVKVEFKKFNTNSYLENIDKLLESDFMMDMPDNENIEALVNAFEISNQLALLMLNVIKSVYNEYQYKTYTEDMNKNSVLFITLVTIILTTAF